MARVSALNSFPLFYFGLGTLGFLATVLLYLRLAKKLALYRDEPGPAPEQLTTLRFLARQAKGWILLLIGGLLLCKTSRVFADAMVLVAAVVMGLELYRARARPLLQAGASGRQVALFVASFPLWLIPFSWFMHLILSGVYPSP